MDKTFIINTSIEKLDKHGLVPKTFPLPFSFQRYNLLIVLLTLISIVRYTTVICLKYKIENSLLLGDDVYPYEINNFSKKCFYTRIFSTVLATSLLYGISLTVNTKHLMALLMVCYWIIFEVGCLAVLAPLSVVEMNRFLYRFLNEL